MRTSILKLTFLPALLAGFVHSAALAASPVLDRISSTGAIRIAYRESSIPFSYVLPSGEPVGYSIDICHKLVSALEKHLKRPLQTSYVPATSANRISLMLSGAAELECGSTTNNRERRQHVAFTIPTFIAGMRLMVPKGSAIRDLFETTERTVVTTKGTTAATLLKDINQNNGVRARVVEASDHASAFDQLATGQADAFLMDDVLLASLRAGSKTPDKFQITGRNLSVEPLAIMLPPNDPEFKGWVDQEMKRMIVAGEINPLYSRWFESPIPPNNINLQLPMSFLLRDSFITPTDWLPN